MVDRYNKFKDKKVLKEICEESALNFDIIEVDGIYKVNIYDNIRIDDYNVHLFKNRLNIINGDMYITGRNNIGNLYGILPKRVNGTLRIDNTRIFGTEGLSNIEYVKNIEIVNNRDLYSIDELPLVIEQDTTINFNIKLSKIWILRNCNTISLSYNDINEIEVLSKSVKFKFFLRLNNNNLTKIPQRIEYDGDYEQTSFISMSNNPICNEIDNFLKNNKIDSLDIEFIIKKIFLYGKEYMIFDKNGNIINNRLLFMLKTESNI